MRSLSEEEIRDTAPPEIEMRDTLQVVDSFERAVGDDHEGDRLGATGLRVLRE